MTSILKTGPRGSRPPGTIVLDVSSRDLSCLKRILRIVPSRMMVRRYAHPFHETEMLRLFPSRELGESWRSP